MLCDSKYNAFGDHLEEEPKIRQLMEKEKKIQFRGYTSWGWFFFFSILYDVISINLFVCVATCSSPSSLSNIIIIFCIHELWNHEIDMRINSLNLLNSFLTTHLCVMLFWNGGQNLSFIYFIFICNQSWN